MSDSRNAAGKGSGASGGVEVFGDDISFVVTERGASLDKIVSCEFDMDTACVELCYVDQTRITIDTIAVENAIADNIYACSELGG